MLSSRFDVSPLHGTPGCSSAGAGQRGQEPAAPLSTAADREQLTDVPSQDRAALTVASPGSPVGTRVC